MKNCRPFILAVYNILFP